MPEAFRLLAVHAHPDDESLISAGTIARAVDAGHRVILVLATANGFFFVAATIFVRLLRLLRVLSG